MDKMQILEEVGRLETVQVTADRLFYSMSQFKIIITLTSSNQCLRNSRYRVSVSDSNSLYESHDYGHNRLYPNIQ